MSYAEPSDVGPAFGGDRRVHDEDRAKVVTLLDTAHAEGRITAAEHAERLSSAQTAQTFDDLVPLTRDLVAVSQASPTSWNQPQQPSAGGPEPELIVTLFGATERRGRWQARRNLSVLNLFGATELDLRQASFTGNVCEINVFCLFGSVDVIVPRGRTCTTAPSPCSVRPRRRPTSRCRVPRRCACGVSSDSVRSRPG